MRHTRRRNRRGLLCGTALVVAGTASALAGLHGVSAGAFVLGVLLAWVGAAIVVIASVPGRAVVRWSAAVLAAAVGVTACVLPVVHDAHLRIGGAAWTLDDPAAADAIESPYWVLPSAVVRVSSVRADGARGTKPSSTLTILDRHDGHQVARATIARFSAGSVASTVADVGDGLLFVDSGYGTGPSAVAAVDGHDGSTRWTRPAASASGDQTRAVAAADGVVVLRERPSAKATTRTVAVGPDGNVVWSVKAEPMRLDGALPGQGIGAEPDTASGRQHGGSLPELAVLRVGSTFQVRDASTGAVLTTALASAATPVAVAEDRVLWVSAAHGGACTGHATQGATILWTRDVPCVRSLGLADRTTATYVPESAPTSDTPTTSTPLVAVDLTTGASQSASCALRASRAACELDVTSGMLVDWADPGTIAGTPLVADGDGWSAKDGADGPVDVRLGALVSRDYHDSVFAAEDDHDHWVSDSTVRRAADGSVMGTVHCRCSPEVLAWGTDGSVLLAVEEQVVMFPGTTD